MNPSALSAQIKAFLARYTLQQKVGMVFASGLVLVLMWTMVYFVNKVEMQVLYSELNPQEAQGIVAKLETMQVPFELSSDGTLIRVAADRIAKVRLDLASQGLPESGRIGFEIFDRTNFGLTNFQEQVYYQRALEGELARSIMTLEEVSAARVHLVLSRESLYQDKEEQTKASVILKLKNGKTLAASSVQGIVNVVANSVKGLSSEKVTVIDYRGKVLSRSDAENSLTGQQLDVRQKMESEMAAKIVQILEPTVGMGKVRPQVSLTMNFQQVEETVEQYDPQASVVRSTQREQETSLTPGGAIPTGGIVGVRPATGGASANPATPPPNATAAPGNTAAPATPATAAPSTAPGQGPMRQNEVINYEVSKSVRHVVNPVGKIERLSVAVVVDNQTQVTPTQDGKTETKSVPRKPEDMTKYKDLVSAAIAYNAERGDQLIVENVSFENEVEVFTEPTFFEKQAPTVLTGVRYIIIPVAFLLVYLLFIRPVQKTVFGALLPAEAGAYRGRALPGAGGAQTPMTVRQLEARLQNGGATPEDAMAAAERELLPLPQASRMDMIRKRVVEHAQQDPETVARLVRVWLNDEKNK